MEERGKSKLIERSIQSKIDSNLEIQSSKQSDKPPVSGWVQLKKKTPMVTALSKPKTILVHRAPIIYSIKLNNADVTPKPLNADLYISHKEKHLSTFDMSSQSVSTSTSAIHRMSLKSLKVRPKDKEFTSQVMSISRHSRQYFSQLEESELLLSSESVVIPQSDTSIDGEESVVVPKTFPPNIQLILNETETFFLLDIASSTVLKDTEEGDEVEELNTTYQFLTQGKGKNRKVINVEVQTMPLVQKTRSTSLPLKKLQDNKVFATHYQMYDTYLDGGDDGKDVCLKYDELKDYNPSSDDEPHKLIESGSLESLRLTVDEKEFVKLAKNQRFLEMACVMERVLASNCFNEQQKRFRGMVEQDLFREDIEYKYSLGLLWTFKNTATKGRCVTALEWNQKNPDLLAVAYGKYFFCNEAKGMIMIWNIKNPVQPERKYDFAYPVTCISFSKSDPNILAIGLYNGHVYVINVVNRDLDIIAKGTTVHEPIWDVAWHSDFSSSTLTKEIVYASVEDGTINTYTMDNTKHLRCRPIMRTQKVEGDVKGIRRMKRCSTINVPISRYSGALLFRKDPVQKSIYFAGTNEGIIQKCSTNYLNQHLDLFRAHRGRINEMKFSPFCPRVFATCGDDWYMRLWGDGISDPLVETSCKMDAMGGLDWSPIHSTIIVSICGRDIIVWDLQRKVYEPQSVTRSPANAKCTAVKFVQSGRCVSVGDTEGNVQIFSLGDMPFSPFFQENLLIESLKMSLITKPEMVQRMNNWKRKTSIF